MFEEVKWLFFDVGSTLIDERIAYEHRIRDIAESANLPYAQVYSDAIKFYMENKKGDIEIAAALGAELPKWHGEDEILYEGVPDVLAYLSGKYRIGIIANQPFGTKERLNCHGILQYIDLVVASAEEGISKPDCRIFEIALRRSGCAPQRSVMIGDRIENDIAPAKLLGMKTIWVRQGFARFGKLTKDNERPDCTINSIKELYLHL